MIQYSSINLSFYRCPIISRRLVTIRKPFHSCRSRASTEITCLSHQATCLGSRDGPSSEKMELLVEKRSLKRLIQWSHHRDQLISLFDCLFKTFTRSEVSLRLNACFYQMEMVQQCPDNRKLCQKQSIHCYRSWLEWNISSIASSLFFSTIKNTQRTFKNYENFVRQVFELAFHYNSYTLCLSTIQYSNVVVSS